MSLSNPAPEATVGTERVLVPATCHKIKLILNIIQIYIYSFTIMEYINHGLKKASEFYVLLPERKFGGGG